MAATVMLLHIPVNQIGGSLLDIHRRGRAIGAVLATVIVSAFVDIVLVRFVLCACIMLDQMMEAILKLTTVGWRWRRWLLFDHCCN